MTTSEIWKLAAGLILAVSLIVGPAARAESEADRDEKQAAIEEIQQMLDLLKNIEYPTEWQEKGRLIVLRNQANKVLACIQNRKMGLGHMSTLREYQTLIVDYRYSTAYFNKISTGATQGQIASLMRLVDQIVNERGFDDSPYTQITLGVFTQMKELFQELQKLPLADPFRVQIGNLFPSLGQVMALAKQGDRPRTFAAAQPVILQIRAMYPLFMKISATDQGYETVLNIQGLSELYAEFAQVDEFGAKQ